MGRALRTDEDGVVPAEESDALARVMREAVGL
jgi:hypothetical protein